MVSKMHSYIIIVFGDFRRTTHAQLRIERLAACGEDYENEKYPRAVM